MRYTAWRNMSIYLGTLEAESDDEALATAGERFGGDAIRVAPGELCLHCLSLRHVVETRPAGVGYRKAGHVTRMVRCPKCSDRTM